MSAFIIFLTKSWGLEKILVMGFILVFWHNIFFQSSTHAHSCKLRDSWCRDIITFSPSKCNGNWSEGVAQALSISIQTCSSNFKHIWTGICNHQFCASFSKNNVEYNSSANAKRQTPRLWFKNQNITNQTNLNKVKIVLSKIWYLNHFKKHCLVLPLTKSDDFLVGVVSFYFRKVDRNDVEVTLKVKLTKTAHNDPWVFFVNVPWFCLRLQIKSAEKINSKICNLSSLNTNSFF